MIMDIRRLHELVRELETLEECDIAGVVVDVMAAIALAQSELLAESFADLARDVQLVADGSSVDATAHRSNGRGAAALTPYQ